MTMTVAQYANKVGIAVDGILSLCNMLGIQVDSADDVLSEEDVLLLDNALKEMLEDNDSNFGGGSGDGGGTGGGSGSGGGETTSNVSSTVEPLKEDNLAVSNAIEYDPSYVKNAMQCLKNMQTMEENPNYGMIGEQISSNRYNIGAYTSEVDSKSYTEMAASLLYYTVQNLDEGFDFGLYDEDYSLEEYYEKMLTGEFNDENGVFDEELAQEYLKNVDLGTEEERLYYTGEFYSKLLNGDFHDENGVYSEELAQEYLNGVSAIIENNNRIRAEERNQIYDDVIVSVGNNYDRRVERYNNRVSEKEKEINEIDNQIAGLQAEIDSARGLNVSFNPFVSSSDTIINLRDVNGIDEKEKQLAELQQQRTDLINESIELKNQRDEFFVDSLAIHTMARDFSDLSSTEGFTIDPKYSDNYRYLTPEEQRVAIYLQNTGRDGKLGQFFGLKQNYFNQMLAQEEAQVVIDNVNYLITKENNAGGRIDSWQEFFNVVGKSMQNAVAGTPGETLATNEEQVFQYLVGVGFTGGLKNFEAGFYNLISADGVPSVEQYKTGYIVEGLKKAYGADGLFEGNAFTSIYEISSSIGNMAPAMAISAVTTALTKNIAVGAKVGEILGTTAMGLSAAGNAREQGLQQGMTNIQAWNYGLMSGSSEAAIGYVLGGIPFLSRMDDIPGVKGYFCKMLGEGLEEGLQSILDPMFVAVATNNEHQFDFNSIDWNEVWKSGVYGAITAGILNGANLLQSATPDNIVKNEIGNVGYYLNEQVANELAAKYEGKDFTDPLVLDEFRSDLEAAVGLDGNSVVFRIGNVEYAISKNLANQIIDKYGNVDTTKRSVMNQVTAEIENTSGVISTELADSKTKKGVYYVNEDGETIISSLDGKFGEVVDIYTELELFGEMQARLNDMGIDTSDMSFEDMKSKYPDIYNEVLNPVKFEQGNSQDISEQSEEDNSNVVIDNFFDYLCELKPTDSPEILELYSSIAEHVKEYNEKGLYTLFNSNEFRSMLLNIEHLENLSLACELYFDYDGKSLLSKELGEFLENLLEKDDLIIGMHNTEIDDLKMKSIFENGLSNAGNNYGEVPGLDFTVRFLENMSGLVGRINSKYKGSKGGFLFAFPKDLVDAEGNIISEAVIDEIYIKKGEGYYINPKYILGYVGYGDDKVVKYYSKDEFMSQEANLVLDDVSDKDSDAVELNDKLTETRDSLKLFDMSLNDFISNFGNVIPMDVKKFFLDIKKVFDDAFNYVNDTVELGNDSVVVDDVEYADDFYVSSMEINNKIQNYLKQVNEILNNYKNQLVEFSEYIKSASIQKSQNLIQKMKDVVKELESSIKSLEKLFVVETHSINYIRNYFHSFGNSIDGTFGADQGGISRLAKYKYMGQEYTYREMMNFVNDANNNGLPLPKLSISKEGSNEYFRLKDKLFNQGFSKDDASVIMSTVDDAGACSYAAVVNEIIASFIGKEAEFEEHFGYSMFTTDLNGNKILNTNELLLDLYVYANRIENGGKFIKSNNKFNSAALNFTRVDVFNRIMLDASIQRFMSHGGSKDSVINNFLRSKGIRYDYVVEINNMQCNRINSNSFDSIISKMKKDMENGKQFTLDIFNKGNRINMISIFDGGKRSCSTDSWTEGGEDGSDAGHAVFITEIRKDGFVVSSWGEEYLIPFEDLKNGGRFCLYSSKIKY